MKNWLKHRLMDPVRSLGGGGDGGGGGDDPSPSPSPSPAGDTPADGGTPSPGPVGSEFKWPEKWKDQLPEDIRGDTSLGVIHDIPTLAKSYINAQKLVGKNKIVLPDEHGTDADWNEVFTKMGLPKDLKDYALKPKEGVVLDEKFVGGFKETLHKAGVLPKQAQKVLDWYTDSFQDVMKNNEKSATEKSAQGFKELDTEWGASYDKNAMGAQLAYKDFADDKTQAWMKESGLDKDPNMMRFLAKVGGVLKEDDLKGEMVRRGNDANVLNPADAQKEYGAIMANMDHPYYKSGHPNHKAAVAEVNKLFRMANPEAKK